MTFHRVIRAACGAADEGPWGAEGGGGSQSRAAGVQDSPRSRRSCWPSTPAAQSSRRAPSHCQRPGWGHDKLVEGWGDTHRGHPHSPEPVCAADKGGKRRNAPWAGRRYERGEGTRAPETTLGPGSWRGLLPAPSHHGLYSPRAGITEPPARLRLSLQVQKGATGRGRCPEHSQYTPWVRAWWGAAGRGEGGGRGGGARRPPPRTPAPAPPCPPSPRPHPTCCFQEPRAHLGTG